MGGWGVRVGLVKPSLKKDDSLRKKCLVFRLLVFSIQLILYDIKIVIGIIECCVFV